MLIRIYQYFYNVNQCIFHLFLLNQTIPEYKKKSNKYEEVVAEAHASRPKRRTIRLTYLDDFV